MAGVQVRRALRRGARLVTVDARSTTLSRVADHDLRPRPGDEATTLTRLLRAARKPESRRPADSRDDALLSAAAELRRAQSPAVVLGPRVFDCAGRDELLAELESLAERPGVTIVPLTHAANARGALELGALAGTLPGPRWDPAGPRSRFDLAALQAGRRPAVLYLIGEAPFEERPPCDYLIAQDLYPPPFPVDAFLPAASFAEADGTLTNLEGRVQELRPVERARARAGHDGPRPDWAILCRDRAAPRPREPRLRRRLPRCGGRSAPSCPASRATATAARRRMTPLPRRRRPAEAAAPGRGRFTLVPERAAFRHRGTDLSAVVEGLGELDLEGGVRMHPGDLDEAGRRTGRPCVHRPRRRHLS